MPELQCADVARSVAYYRDVLGFSIVFERPEDPFAYLDLGGAQIMLDQQGDFWATGPLEHPFGRGINLQIEVEDAKRLRDRVVAAGFALFRDLEDAWYRQGDIDSGNRQFLVQDPDGYLLRFFQDLGTRPHTGLPRRA